MKNVILIIGFLSGLFLAGVFAANESDYKLPVLAEGSEMSEATELVVLPPKESALSCYSTDGFVDDDGMIEIKCPLNERKKIEMWKTGDISEYIHQIQGGLWITGRKWCDFIMFDPDYDVVGKNLYIQRITRDDDFIEAMEYQLVAFMHRVDAHVKFMREAA